MIALLPGQLELAYEEAGSGPPLLYIHGWPHNRMLWSAQLSGLSTHARCIAPDLRGFGASTVARPYSMSQYADDLVALLDSLGIERAIVCGLSMGGYVAMAMLRHHRDRVRALILASTRATADTPEAREKRMRLIAFVREQGVEALAARQLRAMVGETTCTSRPELVESLRRLMAAAPLEGVVGGLEAMANRPDSTELLSTADIPTLVIGGAEDTFTPPTELGQLAEVIPGARLELIATAGHVCAFERPAAFDHLVAEFLEALVLS
jgi:pimeloyl-ACP methyl ester carboxylesterase